MNERQFQDGDAAQWGPDPLNPYPLQHYHRLCYLKNIVDNPNIIIGDYTYYDDFENPENFKKNVLYHFDFIGDKLIIGKFCAIASDVKFIMNGGNHHIDRFAAYPFYIFGNGWEKVTPTSEVNKGDTIIGNDVWFGYDSLIMPGVKIGDGSVIGTRAVVTKDVAPYTIVAGNPARPIRKRFEDEAILLLLDLKWWDWEIEKITKYLPVLYSNDLDRLRACRKML
ncbi:MAG: CatB-related O-acetyltransferase [Cyanobacteriota bacterium]|nr:CatB-related O-acetyltransferase [Cyanobacteriota bacterium]